jgi:hypothetical protein
MDKIEIEWAPREKLRFLGALETFLLKLLRYPEALITDESSLWDFCLFDSEDAIGRSNKPGYYLFKKKFRRGGFPFILDEDPKWEERIIESRALPFRKMTARKIFRHTGVDISSVFDEPIPIILHFIAENIPPGKRHRVFSSK